MNGSTRVRRCLSSGAAQGYGPVPPASRVAAAIAAGRACGPPLTPEPLRPLNAPWHGQTQGAARRARGANPKQPRSNPYNQSLYGSLENNLRRRVRE